MGKNPNFKEAGTSDEILVMEEGQSFIAVHLDTIEKEIKNRKQLVHSFENDESGRFSIWGSTDINNKLVEGNSKGKLCRITYKGKREYGEGEEKSQYNVYKVEIDQG